MVIGYILVFSSLDHVSELRNTGWPTNFLEENVKHRLNDDSAFKKVFQQNNLNVNNNDINVT